MNRKKSLVALIILLFGLFLLGGCGNNTEDGVIEAGGGTVLLEAKDNDTTIAEGNSTVLTATVSVTRKDSKGVYVTDHYPGQAVTFVIISNNTGGTVTPMNGGITNADGVASAVYTAGKLKKGLVVQDTIQAHIAGYSGQIIITRTGVESGYAIALAASPTSVAAGQNSVVTATVTATSPEGASPITISTSGGVSGGGASSYPVSGQVVTFSFVANNSGGYLVTVNAVTDATGRATATYTAGSSSPGIDVTDTVQATAGGSTAVVAITRTEGQGYGITLTADPDKFGGNWQGQTVRSVLTAIVTSESKELSGQTVTFTIISGGGSLSSLTARTDGTGTAVVTYSRYISENTGDGQTVIFAVIKARLSSGAEAEARIGIGTYTEE